MRAHRKDFVRIARILHAAQRLIERGYGTVEVFDVLIDDFADMLGEDHATFDRERFVRAAKEGTK